MTDLQEALRYAEDHRETFLDDFREILRIPSISTLPENEPDIQRAADWMADHLRQLGFDSVAVMPTARHPVVYGERLEAGPKAPTILFYGHYDVQPVDPIEEWTSPPFNPEIRGENLYARGASDMKGQVVAFLKALEALTKTGNLQINLKMMLEGEEEIGSPSIESFIESNKELLQCDMCLNADAGITAADDPAITYTLRGLAYFELRLQGARSDLHSGVFGGAVDNPGMVLCELIAGMRDDKGRITLPGFYDNVRPLTEVEREELSRISDETWLEQSGAQGLYGEEGYIANERATSRPTLDVNGLLCGFTGEGSKTVLPAKAMAKLSTRLVPDQHADQVERMFREYLEANVPSTMTWELEGLASCSPAIIERDSDAVKAASRAFKAVWKTSPSFARQGGSVPVVSQIQDLLGVDSLMLGFALPDDNIHAPDEKQHLPTLYRGIDTYIHFLMEMAG